MKNHYNNKIQGLSIVLAVFISSTFTISNVHANNDDNSESTNKITITTNKHRVKPQSSLQLLSTNTTDQQSNNQQKTRGQLKQIKQLSNKFYSHTQFSQANINSLKTRGYLTHASM